MHVFKNKLIKRIQIEDERKPKIKKVIARDSNIELLRILSMILIVAHHFSIHGVLKQFQDNSLSNQSFTSFLAQVIQLGGKTGVTLFILITGYFMIQSNVKIKKIYTLFFQVLFYSVCGLFIATLLGNSINLSSIIKAFFPIIHEQYWFITAYVVLYLISPYLNKLLLSLTEKEYANMLGIMTLLWIVVPTFTRGEMGSSNITRFILFYSIGSYLRLYPMNKYNNKRVGFLLSVVSYFLMLLSVVMLNILGKELGSSYLINKATYFSSSSSLLILSVSIGLFIWMKNTHIKPKSWINKISGATLGVYLIHDNRNIRSILWHDIFNTEEHVYDSPLEFLIYSAYAITTVFLISVLLELLRQKLFNKMKL